jgi:hypothetical protein
MILRATLIKSCGDKPWKAMPARPDSMATLRKGNHPGANSFAHIPSMTMVRRMNLIKAGAANFEAM